MSLDYRNLFNQLLVAERYESIQATPAATRRDGPGAGGEQRALGIRPLGALHPRAPSSGGLGGEGAGTREGEATVGGGELFGERTTRP